MLVTPPRRKGPLNSLRTRSTARSSGNLPWLICAAALVVALASVPGSESSRAEHAPQHETVIATFPERFPPIFTVSPNGLPDGFGIDVMEEVAAQAELKIHYDPAPTWSAANERLRTGEADLIPNLGITPERREFADFSQPVSDFEVAVFVRRDEQRIRGPEDLARATRGIAVVEDNVAQTLLADRQDLDTIVYPSVGAAFFGLVSQEVDALVYPHPVIDRMARQVGATDRIKSVGAPLTTVQRAIAVAKGREELLARINEALPKVISSEEYQRLLARWYGPVEPYWNARRVSYVFGGVLAALLAMALYWRFHVLRRANRRLSDAIAFNEAVLNAAREGVVSTDTDGIIRSLNRGAETIFGYDAEALIGRPLERIVKQSDDTNGSLQPTHTRLTHQGPDPHVPLREATGIRRDGSRMPVHVGVAQAQAAGETIHVYTVYDLSDQRAAEQEAAFLADHDPLTGLLNPRGSMLVLENLIEQARRNGREITCIHLGLMHFGQINSLYGRNVGDRLLVQVARRLEANLRTSDSVGRSDNGIIARPEGAGFLVILPETGTSGASELARRLRGRLANQVFELEGHSIHLQIKFGIAAFPEHADSGTELVSYAHAALTEAKSDPTLDLCVFTAETKTRETNEQQWLERIHDAIGKDRLELHFQPILHIDSGAVRQHEVLVRMRQTDGSLTLPGEFIQVAERYGVIVDIDDRVLALVLDELERSAADPDPVVLSVNLSAAYVGDHDLYDWLAGELKRRAIDPHRLIFEVTETAAIRNVVRACSFMENLKGLGCRFALDDFGTGFSSFSYLRTLPVDIIKIDGSFVRRLADNPADQALVQSVTRIAHSLDKTVVAEHVEDQQVLELLRGYGVDYAQGYHIGRPTPDRRGTRG